MQSSRASQALMIINHTYKHANKCYAEVEVGRCQWAMESEAEILQIRRT